MRKIISFLFLLFITVTASSKTFRLSIEPGYGFYDLGKLHQLQEIAVNFHAGLGIKAVEEFPPFYNQSGSILWYATPNLLFGITTEFLSTGARNSAKDYSGDYKLDMLVHGILYGLETEYNFRLMPNLRYFVNLKAGKINSTLDMSEKFVVANTVLINDKDSLKDNNLFVEPSVGLRYEINKSFSISFSAGYLIDLDAYNDKIINWSGFQLKGGVAYYF